MITRTLSPQALQTIHRFFELRIGDRVLPCPYFNNRRSKIRAGLRAVIGKGTPEEIVDEANLFALREKIDLKALNQEDLKKFLVEHNLGIDCSAFAYYILNTQYQTKHQGALSSKIFFPNRSFLRRLLIKLRPIENISVSTLNHEKNTQPISLAEVKPGDVIIMLNAGNEHNLNHVLVIQEVEYEGGQPQKIHYVHSFAWSTDGKYNHGIKFGIIEITNPNATLLEQNWIEHAKVNNENETFLRASDAEVLELKRVNVL